MTCIIGIEIFTVSARSLTRAEQQSILRHHNEARRLAGLPGLKWSTEIAKTSSSWADTLGTEGCTMRHASHIDRKGYGENLYMAWSSDRRFKLKSSDVMQGWLDEAVDYTYDSNSCTPGRMCGHYTQIVWRGTTKLGCGKTQCSTSN